MRDNERVNVWGERKRNFDNGKILENKRIREVDPDWVTRWR